MLQWLEIMKWCECGKKGLILLLRYNTNTWGRKQRKPSIFFAEKPVSWSIFKISTIQTGHKSANHYTASEKGYYIPQGGWPPLMYST
jgi:hypothetical protein